MNVSAFPIVGIGASAGGIEAFHSLFKHMPPNCGMAFVILLHLPADRNSMLTDILARWTSMRVVDAVDGARIEPNCIYVPPPHSLVTVSDNHLRVQLPQTNDGLSRPIDGFFDSLASMRERAVGIVLSGTGRDGAVGLKAIKDCGGLTLAQGTDASAPQYGEMPAGAMATAAADFVVPVEQMPGHLMRWQSNGATTADGMTGGTEEARTPAGDGAGPAVAKRILVADDNRDGAETMSMLLKLSGHEVYLAHSGAEALEVARRERPDIAVLDIGMPDLNGYEVAERIRHEAWSGRIKLIAVTGWGQAEDKRRALAAGFDHHLTKPVDPSELEALFTA